MISPSIIVLKVTVIIISLEPQILSYYSWIMMCSYSRSKSVLIWFVPNTSVQRVQINTIDSKSVDRHGYIMEISHKFLSFPTDCPVRAKYKHSYHATDNYAYNDAVTSQHPHLTVQQKIFQANLHRYKLYNYLSL